MVRKRRMISAKVGSLSPVVERIFRNLLDQGIGARQEQDLTEAISVASAVVKSW